MNVEEALKGIIRRKKAAGQETEWLSEANLSVLGHVPMQETRAVAACEMPSPPKAKPQPETSCKASVPAVLDTSRETAAGGAAMQEEQAEYAPAPDVTQADWRELVACCGNCRACGLARTRLHVVVEDGCRNAEVMFIGEGPGQDEDIQGVPFVGRAGQLLTKMIAAMKRSRAADAPPETAVYIANIVKCRPPGNRNPEPQEANACIGYLKRQIELVRPKVIVLLGGVPLLALMGLTGITRKRGRWLEYQGIPVMPTFHPAYLLRFERFPDQFVQNKRLVWQDLQAVMARLAEAR